MTQLNLVYLEKEIT